MSLTHEQFFALAIDPDGAPDPSLLPEIEEHRRTCQECAELERDYPKMVQRARSMPLSAPPEPPGTEEKIRAAAREALAARRAAAVAQEPRGELIAMPRHYWMRFAAGAAAAVVLFAAGGFTGWESRGPGSGGKFDYLQYREGQSLTGLDDLQEEMAAAKALYALGYFKPANQLAQDVKTKTKIPAFVNDADDIINGTRPR